MRNNALAGSSGFLLPCSQVLVKASSQVVYHIGYQYANRYQRAMAYVSRDVERIAKILSLKKVTSGANVTLLIPCDEGVFHGAKSIDGIYAASPVQVYLDLLELKGRGEEAAQTILDEVIRRSW